MDTWKSDWIDLRRVIPIYIPVYIIIYILNTLCYKLTIRRNITVYVYEILSTNLTLLDPFSKSRILLISSRFKFKLTFISAHDTAHNVSYSTLYTNLPNNIVGCVYTHFYQKRFCFQNLVESTDFRLNSINAELFPSR